MVVAPIPNNPKVNSNGIIGITVVNSQGVPSPVSAPITVVIGVSNSGIISVDSSLTLNTGTFSGILNYTAIAVGETGITATVSGMTSGTSAINVESPSSTQPNNLNTLSLSMSLEPDSLALNQNGTIQVALVAANGNAVPAPVSTTVMLFSSNLTIAAVPPSVTIAQGSLLGVATLSTLNLGSSQITALVNGMAPVTAPVTVTPSYAQPTGISLSTSPAGIPANGAGYQTLFISLTNGGAPAVALKPVNITLSSTNPNIGTAPSTVVIPSNTEYVGVSFTTSSVGGSTSITAVSENLIPATTTLTTYSAAQLSVTIAPFALNLPTGETGLDMMGVFITGSTGISAPVSTPTTINLNTSNPGIVGVPGSVTVPAGSDFAAIPVTTSAPGTVVVEATAPGYSSSSVSIAISTLGPYQAGLYVAPTDALTLNGVGNSIFVIQLQDSSGKPVGATSDVTVSLVPSNFALYNKTIPITILPGETEAIYSAPFLGSGNSSFSLSGAGLHLPAPVTVYNTVITPSLTFGYSPQGPIYTKSTLTATAVVSLGGATLSGVNVMFQIMGSNHSEISNSAGIASVTFQTPSSPSTVPITMYASSQIFGSAVSHASILVTRAPIKYIYTKFTWPPEIILGVPPQLSLSATLLIAIAAVAAVGVFSWKVKHNLFFLKRKKKQVEGEEETEEEQVDEEET